MRIGVNLPNYGPLGDRAAITAIATRAEELGYDSLWTTDHILLPKADADPYGHLLETLTTLSYLAGRTERVELGTSVLVLPQRDPLLVAKQAATLFELSAGRFVLGVGVGWSEGEYRFLGYDFADRGARADEDIRVLRELWTSPRPAFDGRWTRFSDAVFSPFPGRPGGIPIVVGGSRAPALRRAALLGDGWHASRRSPEQVRAGVATIAGLAGDRRVEISLRIGLAYGREPDDPSSMLGGTPEQIAAGIATYREAGVEHFVLAPQTPDRDAFLADLERFAAEVRPGLAA